MSTRESIPIELQHHIIDTHIDVDHTLLVAMCNGTQFHIFLSRRELKGTALDQKYVQLSEDIINGDVSNEDDDDPVAPSEVLFDWMMSPCIPQFTEFTPECPKEMTLQDFYCPPVRRFRLFIDNEGSLQAKLVKQIRSRYQSNLVMPVRSLPLTKHIAFIKAADVRTRNLWGCYLPDMVELDGSIKFFKGVHTPSQIIREVEMHEKIRACGLDKKLRIPNLCGIVVARNGIEIPGLIFDVIKPLPETANMHDEACVALKQYHARWEKQVTDAVKMLHEHDIIWGDVHPGNIIIDEEYNAWIIDFGGGFVKEFVNPRNYGTKKGDWEGVKNVFEVFLKR